jgi:hypothetical protein
MRWRTLALLVACGFLTGACSASAADRGFVPSGGAAGAASSQAAAAKQSSGVETITVVPGLRVEVEWPAGLESSQIAMIKAFGDSYVGQWRAVGTTGKDDTYLGGVEDAASRDAYAWVRGFLKARQSARGVARLYSLRVASVTGRGAEVDACVDESGVRVTDRTGEPIPDQPIWTKPPTSIYLQVAAVRRGDDATWRVKLFRHAVYPDERAKECVR